MIVATHNVLHATIATYLSLNPQSPCYREVISNIVIVDDIIYFFYLEALRRVDHIMDVKITWLLRGTKNCTPEPSAGIFMNAKSILEVLRDEYSWRDLCQRAHIENIWRGLIHVRHRLRSTKWFLSSCLIYITLTTKPTSNKT